MRKIFVAILLSAIVSCSTNKDLLTHTPISQEEFLEMPFGFEENISSFKNITKPVFKTQKVLRKNKHYSEKTDTIYKFIYKKSSIYFYKTYMNQEFLLAGKVLNKEVILKNGIQIGISKDDFTSRFSDKLNWQSDSIQMVSEGTKYTFIFMNDRLNEINIDNYFD